MLTPQTIQDKKFERAVFGGYDMSQVDVFLDEVLADYTALYKENATLKAKMKVVVDKLEEYRSVDEEVRKTLYTAKMSAKDTVSAAQAEADKILSQARSEAQQRFGDIEKETEDHEIRLERAKAATREYVAKIKDSFASMTATLEKVIGESAPGELKHALEDFEVELPPEIAEKGAKELTGDERTQVFSPVTEAADAISDALSELKFGSNYSEE